MMISPMDLKQMLDNMIELTGEEFDIVRDDERHLAKAARNSKTGSHQKFLQFYPDENIKVGDVLIRRVTGEKWTVVEVDPHLIEGHVFTLNVFYQTGHEKEQLQPQIANYTFIDSSNIIAGNQTYATMNVDIGKIEKEIEERGGDDVVELLEMVSEIKQTFEKQNSITKGSLAKFSEMLEKHSWITGSLIQLLGSAAIQFFIA